MTALPSVWKDLLDALTLLSKHPSNDSPRPFLCEHDELTVFADPAKFTDEELMQLEEWGFHPGSVEMESFTSFRFGSA